MAVWPAGLMAIVIFGSIAAGSEDSMLRVRRDDDDDDDSGDRHGSQVLLCPCSQGCCDDGWYQYKDACYLPVFARKNWKAATENCEDLNAHLVSIHSEEEDSFIFHLMQKRHGYWLGAEKTQASWKWIDNSTWDYSDIFIHHAAEQLLGYLAVHRTDDRGKTYWRMVPKLGQRKYVCKYQLD